MVLRMTSSGYKVRGCPGSIKGWVLKKSIHLIYVLYILFVIYIVYILYVIYIVYILYVIYIVYIVYVIYIVYILYEKSNIPFSYMLYAYSVKRAYRGTKPKESFR